MNKYAYIAICAPVATAVLVTPQQVEASNFEPISVQIEAIHDMANSAAVCVLSAHEMARLPGLDVTMSPSRPLTKRQALSVFFERRQEA